MINVVTNIENYMLAIMEERKFFGVVEYRYEQGMRMVSAAGVVWSLWNKLFY